MYNNPYMNNPMTEYYRSQMQQAAQPVYPQSQFNQPQFSQNYQQQTQYRINQVTSVEEARSQMVDPLVTSLYMDTSAGKIYLKRLNNQGTADFLTFSLEQPIQQKEENPLDMINQRLKAIEEKLGGNYGSKSTTNVSADDESGAGNAAAVVTADAKAESAADE